MAGSAGVGILASDELCYGSAAESESVARLWLDKHNKCFGQFVNGTWNKTEGRATVDVKKPTTGEKLATVLKANDEDIAFAADNSKQAFKSWSELSGHARAQHLYSIARNLQKHQSLLAVVEAVSSGQPTRETRGLSAPAAIRYFYHNAGWAGLMEEQMRGWKPYGVIAIVVPAWLPLVQMAGKVASALAMGNTVLVIPPASDPLSCLLLADICSQAGLPAGVLNVVTGADVMRVAAKDGLDKIVFAGSASEGKALRQMTAGSGKDLSLEMFGRSSVLVFEGADLDSAVEGIVEAAFFNSGQTFYTGSRLLIQETVYKAFVQKLKARIYKLTVGDNLDKNVDQGPLLDDQTFSCVASLVERAKAEGAEVVQACDLSTVRQNSFPPTLITNVQTSSEIYLKEVLGPIVVAVPFRTVKESVTIANHTPFGLAASVWTEDLTVALEVAALLQVSTVWVNGHHMYDAASGTGASKASGFGRTGGKEGLYEYVKPSWQNRLIFDGEVDKKFGSASSPNLLPGAQVASGGSSGDGPGVDKTYKLFYGGGQKRPDSGASRPVLNRGGTVVGYVPDGGRKDIRNAVEAAVKAVGSWSKKEGHGRAQIMYYLAENLESHKEEYAALLSTMTGQELSSSAQEVQQAVQRLFYWAAYCDKYGGDLQETPFSGFTVKRHESVGTIGIVCPDEAPLLSFISLMAPAISRGNPVIAVPSGKYPMAALGFQQILETSDVPAGVVNILTGDSDVLARALAEHHDISAVWYFGSEAGSRYMEFASAGNFKRTWVNYGVSRDFSSPEQGQGPEFLYQATASKCIWLPMGTIFAN
ncbi:aldehyde dehydrogenase family 16 member A1 [Aplysia californica]|uniref:Aldehyde dehydrogenase family 16 member A1 n=1 Tax=Aplysia californica TaxID=6500 RepID=A0ABM0JJ25_APLCA|nr:aldehyde dehydrogenase family 16 member A1 [Aplysia californica]